MEFWWDVILIRIFPFVHTFFVKLSYHYISGGRHYGEIKNSGS